jgi:anti-sigma regulatory factor (Ser/Thr protein kinase)
MDVTTITFPCKPESVGIVRTLARSLFDRFERGYEAELITSELVTNSVVHSRSRYGGRVTARFTIGEASGRIEIVDDGPAAEPIPADQIDEHRRGLRFIVDTCADKWGQDAETSQTTYWAELHWG